jgi:hypothetical protein
VTSIWFVRRTRATLRSAEFGFFGVTVFTTVQTPRFCGQLRSMASFFWELKPDCSAGEVDLYFTCSRPFLTNWLNVGIFGFTSL